MGVQVPPPAYFAILGDHLSGKGIDRIDLDQGEGVLIEHDMTNATDISTPLALVRGRIESAAARAGRPSRGVDVIAVTKGHPAPFVRVAAASGILDIGENRVQEALEKVEELQDIAVRWHLIGTLQTNKARPAVRQFQMVQSVDRAEIASALKKECDRQNKSLDVLVQVEASGEPTKHGARPDQVPALIDAVLACPRLHLRGLMTIGPLTPESDKIRACFRTVAELFRIIRSGGKAGPSFDTLSMGMSGDFEIAVEEGATMLRLGTALFGARSAP